MVYNFLCKDEKKTCRNIYLLLLKNIGVERSPPFFRTVYPDRNNVTTHPDIFQKEIYFLFKSFVKIELSYVFTINMYSTAKTAWKSELSHKNR